MSVSAEEFVKAWQESGSSQEAADKMNMSVSLVSSRAYGYRKKGVKLKRMPGSGKKPIDVAALNKLIASMSKNGKA